MELEAEDDEDKAEDVDKEPQITSSDPHERKLARKLRIERRLEAIRKLNMPEGEEEEEVVEKTLLQQQLLRSFELLEKLSIEGNEFVTNVRVANDAREVDRREEEGVGREKIIQQLEEEAASAAEQFAAIADKWRSIMEYNDPLQINDEIAAQREKCDELVKQKDEMVAMLRNQIKDAELKFAKDQRKQNEDIETLANRIEKQVTMMRSAYRQELQLIEDVIMVERRMLIESNDKKWEELYKKRDHEEQMNANRKTDQLEEFEEMCNKLRIDHQEKHRETKIKLENDIEHLQQELEQIKMLALMNSEKLDYNYQILKKREDENIIIKSQQKRRINKLQDVTNTLRKKISEYKKYAKDETEYLAKEVRKLQANVLDIENKADHFSHINNVKYEQIWNLNQKRATEVLNKILTIDRILHEQQLGLTWTNPEQQLLEKSDLPSYKSAMEIVDELLKKDEENPSTTKNKTDTTNLSKHIGTSTMSGVENQARRNILKSVLKLIADKSGFLIENRLIEILKPYMEREKTLIKVDSVFSALGVKKKEEIEVLLEYFLPYTHCPICTEKSGGSAHSLEIEIQSQNLASEVQARHTSLISSKTTELLQPKESIDVISAIHQPQEVIDEIVSTIVESASISPQPTDNNGASNTINEPDEDETTKPSTIIFKIPDQPQVKVLNEETEQTAADSNSELKLSCHNRHPLVISSVYILRALKQFVSKFYTNKGMQLTMSSRLSHKRSTVSRLISGEDVKIFWTKFKTVFGRDKQALWDALMTGLQKYHEILKDRKKLNDEVIELRKQNSELKHLLYNYQKDKERKLKPPCALQREIPIKALPL